MKNLSHDKAKRVFFFLLFYLKGRSALKTALLRPISLATSTSKTKIHHFCMVKHEKEAWWFACLLIEQPANCLIVVVKPEKALILTETTPADYVAARPQ